MIETIIASVITGAVSIVITVITVIANGSKTRHVMQTSMALQEQRQGQTEKKIDELAAEVKAHNEYGRQIPVLAEQIKVINHRLDDLERGQS